MNYVYERLAQKPADAWKEQFRAHPLFVRYVQSRLPAVGQPERAPTPRQAPTFKERLQLFLHQCRILSGRYLRIQLADQRALAMMFGQCLLVAALLSLLFGNLEKKNFFEAAKQSPTLLFLMAVSCLWFGCNNAAKEIVKERLIYSRERDVNLLVPSYYASKVALLGAWTVLQVIVLFGIVKLCTQLSGSALGQFIFLAMLSLVGVTLGLFISAISKSDDMAVTLVPIVLIPQIALAGVVAPVEGVAKLLAQLAITTYWGYRGLATLLPENMTHAIGSHDWSAAGAFSVLALHALLFAAAALGFLMFGEGGGRGAYGKGIDHWLASAASRLSRTVQALDK